jgi:hypothetical protein
LFLYNNKIEDNTNYNEVIKFNYGEFATIKSYAGLNNYKISVREWVEKTHAIGLKASAGRYLGGTCMKN